MNIIQLVMGGGSTHGEAFQYKIEPMQWADTLGFISIRNLYALSPERSIPNPKPRILKPRPYNLKPETLKPKP